jgi:hypothetical protein
MLQNRISGLIATLEALQMLKCTTSPLSSKLRREAMQSVFDSGPDFTTELKPLVND